MAAELLSGHDGYPRSRHRRPGARRVIVAEIGDIPRFRQPPRLCSQAGLTPRHRESDTKVIRGRIT